METLQSMETSMIDTGQSVETARSVEIPVVTDEFTEDFTDLPAAPAHKYSRGSMVTNEPSGPQAELGQENPKGSTNSTEPVETDDPVEIDLSADMPDHGKKFQSAVHYLEPDAVWSHADVKLLSSDGSILKINASMLASLSSYLAAILKSLPDGEEVAISTEIPADKLKIFIEFVTTGTMSVTELDLVQSDFACLGVDLLQGFKFQMSYRPRRDPLHTEHIIQDESELNPSKMVPSICGVQMQPVNAEQSDVQVLFKPPTVGQIEREPCFALILSVNTQVELLAKGKPFLQKHAIEHLVLDIAGLDVVSLAAKISKHYLEYHMTLLTPLNGKLDPPRESRCERRKKEAIIGIKKYKLANLGILADISEPKLNTQSAPVPNSSKSSAINDESDEDSVLL